MQIVPPSFSLTYPTLYGKLIVWAAERLDKHRNWFIREHKELIYIIQQKIWDSELKVKHFSKPSGLFRRREEDTHNLLIESNNLLNLKQEKETVEKALYQSISQYPTGQIDGRVYSLAVKEVDQYLEDIYWKQNRHVLPYWNERLSRPEKWHLKKVVQNYHELFQGWSYAQAARYQVLTEPTKSIFQDDDHRYEGRISVNSYQCRVLNAARMFIIDIDVACDHSHDYDRSFFSSGGRSGETVVCLQEKEQSACDRPDSAGYKNRADALNALKEFSFKNRDLGFRVYHTAGGLRLIETTRQWSPVSGDVEEIMRELKADPLYAALCKTQETFRARLSPKPWRVSEDEHAVTAFQSVVGSKQINPAIEKLLVLHDDFTSANDRQLTLA